jgi:hypothetical protein
MEIMKTLVIISDFKWVMKLLESSKNSEHMNTSLRCFTLWENKYTYHLLMKNDKIVIDHLRNEFWSKFNNKLNTFGTINL